MKSQGSIRHLIPSLIFLLFIASCNSDRTELPDSVSVGQDDVNGVSIQRNNKVLIFYGDTQESTIQPDKLLLTHCRRDLTWVAESSSETDTDIIVPAGEKVYFTRIDSFWTSFTESRFHDYEQQTTKYPTRSLGNVSVASCGDIIMWEDLEFRVIDTPGYTRNAVTYISTIDEVKIAFTGDLIYGDGKIFDIYSLQDKVEDLNIMGYHGYASRIAALIKSLEEVKKHNPDILVPSRGPIIYNPDIAIDKLIFRLRKLYSNYLSTSAYHWYSGPEKQELLAEKVLSPEMTVPWMPYAETSQNQPDWLIHKYNTVLIKSEDGSAFLIDCGYKRTFEELINNTGELSHTIIEGIFITHYHDDHTEYIPELVKKYKCPVYATKELENVLLDPGSYKLPAMTNKSIDNITVVPEGHKMDWKEFTFTFHYYPGQTILHDALLVETENEKVFFIGDSFSPSGMDDYCLLNRNIIQKGEGYLYCLDLLRDIPENTWLVNQHIGDLFRFSTEQIDLMEQRLLEREKILEELSPWENANMIIDEQWARIFPYGISVESGKYQEFSVIVKNHFPVEKKYTVRPHLIEQTINFSPQEQSVTVPPQQEDTVTFSINIPLRIDHQLHIITADISFDDWYLHDWCEGILRVGM